MVFLKRVFLALLSFFVFSLGNAQNLEANTSLEQAQVLAQSNLEQLKYFADNSQNSSDNFIFLIVVPSAMSATMDFILVAGTIGYLSQQNQKHLEDRVSSMDRSSLSLREIYQELENIFAAVQNAILNSKRNEEKLKAHGYTLEDISHLVKEIEVKNQMCSNKENNNSPESFCSDYKESFAREGYKLKKERGGWIVTKKGKFQCCLEWDNVHCGFEIFDKSSEHKGEVGCLPDEFNPCEANLNRGAHAAPQPADHRPRSKACSK